jgi:hypothetical protein
MGAEGAEGSAGFNTILKIKDISREKKVTILRI